MILVLVVSAKVAFGAEVPGTDELTIQIDASVRGKSVSPLLYGIFVEEYNHNFTGGLYAEMLRNRSFEDRDTPLELTAPLATVYRKDPVAVTHTPEGSRAELVKSLKAARGGIVATNSGLDSAHSA